MRPTPMLLALIVVLAGCSAFAPEPTATPLPTETPIPPTETPTPTFTPTPTETPTPTLTPTSTPSPTPTEAPCSHVDLNGRYVDFRTWRGAIWGWIMYVEQNGCEFTARETFFLRASGPGSQTDFVDLTGTIERDRVRICYVATGYCLNLVIFGRGDKLVNGVEGWQYEKSGE